MTKTTIVVIIVVAVILLNVLKEQVIVGFDNLAHYHVSRSAMSNSKRTFDTPVVPAPLVEIVQQGLQPQKGFISEE